MLAPAGRRNNQNPLPVQCLLYRPAKVGQFLRGEESMFLLVLSRAARHSASAAR
jgi:hypothetical protein